MTMNVEVTHQNRRLSPAAVREDSPRGRGIIPGLWSVIFRAPLSPGAGRAVEGFAFYGAGLVLAKLLSVSAQVLVGRLRGPEVYGRLTLVLILANYLSLPMVGGWGLAYVRLHAVRGEADPPGVLKMLLLVCAAATALTVILTLAAGARLAGLLQVDESAVWLAVAVALATAWWMLAKTVFQAFQDWRRYVAVELVWSLVLLLGMAAALAGGATGLATLSGAFILAYLAGGSLAGPRLLGSLAAPTHWPHAREIMHHGALMLLTGLVGTLAFGIDRLLMNRSLGAAVVGYYQAHFLATYGLVSALMTMLFTYLFPLFARDTEGSLRGYLRTLTLCAYPAIFLLSAASGTVLLRLYGYPTSWATLLTLSLFGAVFFHGQVEAWRLAGRGATSTRRVLAAQVAFLAANVLLLVILLPRLGMPAGGLALLGASVVSLGMLRPWAREG